MDNAAERTLLDWLRLARDGWPALVVLVVIGLGAGVAGTVAQTKRFGATSTLVTSPATGFLDPSDANTLPGVADTVARLLETRRVLRRVAPRFAALATDPAARSRRRAVATSDWLADRLVARRVGSTSIIEISATAATQLQAQDLARAAAASLADVVNAASEPAAVPRARGPNAQQPQPLARQGIFLRSFSNGEPKGKISPTPVRNLLIGGNAGLLLGIVAALALGLARERLRRPEDVAAALQVPLLGAVRARRGGVSLADPGLAEARARLLAYRPGPGGRAILITGTVRSRRIADVSEALARAFAASSATAVVVDADLETASLTRRLGLDAEVGLGEAINGQRAEGLVIGATFDASGLAVLPAGHVDGDAASAFARGTLAASIGKLRETHEFVIIAGPNLDRPAEVLSLLEVVDYAVVVAALGRPARQLDKVAGMGEALRRRLAGAVLVDGRRAA